mmetsp:Transcript_9719/g.19627  ORF Transcript_9719/g.19627 Transcript_9719/m.19627 type:complete len:109 (-) Transcript_9719:216-542(-)
MMDGIKMDGKTTDGMMMATTRWDGRVMTTGLVLGNVLTPTAVRLTGGEETFPFTTVSFVRRMATASAGLGMRMAVLVSRRGATREVSASQQKKIAYLVTVNEGPSICY